MENPPGSTECGAWGAAEVPQPGIFRVWGTHLEFALFLTCLPALGSQPRVWQPKQHCHEPTLGPSLWKNEFQSHIGAAHLCPCFGSCFSGKSYSQTFPQLLSDLWQGKAGGRG